MGGVAVQAHGYIRATADLDVVPRPTLLNLSRLGETLVELEAAPRRTTATINVTDPQLLKRVPMVPLITRYGRLDLLNIEHLAGAPASYEELDPARSPITLDRDRDPRGGAGRSASHEARCRPRAGPARHRGSHADG